MDDVTNKALNGIALCVGMLIYELDAAGSVDKKIIVGTIRKSADNLEVNPGPKVDAYSAAMMRRIADIVEGGPDRGKPAWSPVVIDGGRGGPESPDPEG